MVTKQRGSGATVVVSDGGTTAEPSATSGDARAVGDPPEPASYTIDGLSQHTGVPGRTIRFYQSQGVLQPPRRSGRMAFYDDEHVRRLRLIAELRDRGLRLDAIRDALEQLEAGGDSLQTWLGLSERFSDPWTEDKPVLVSADELLGRYGGGRPGLLSDLEALGLIVRQGSGVRPSYLVETIAFVDALVGLEQAGLEFAVSMGAAEIMGRSIAALARELVAYYATVFKDRILSNDGEGHESVLKAYAAIRPIGFDTVRIMFGQEIDRAIREIVEGGPVAIERIVKSDTSAAPVT